MLLTFCLEKLSKIDMSFLSTTLVQSFTEELQKFSKGLKAGAST
jgi:hypothetical protein